MYFFYFFFKSLVREILISEDENVVFVDWEKGAGLHYSKSVANTRVVGVQLAYLIYTLHVSKKCKLGFSKILK